MYIRLDIQSISFTPSISNPRKINETERNWIGLFRLKKIDSSELNSISDNVSDQNWVNCSIWNWEKKYSDRPGVLLSSESLRYLKLWIDLKEDLIIQ